MSGIVISGLRHPLNGTVTLSGAKNSALIVLAATVLAREEVILDNIPLGMQDVHVKLQMLRAIGADVTEDPPGRVRIKWPSGGPQSDVPFRFGSVRTSLLFLGALLARTGHASVPLPGGCQLGERKHDLHLMALQRLGFLQE